MQAAIINAGDIEVATLPDPEPAPGQILVAPKYTGICGSDLHVRAIMKEMADSLGETERAEIPNIVPGHEFSAEIVGFGAGTDSPLKFGDRIVPIPFTPMGHDHQIIGLSPLYSGGIATLSLVDAERCFRIPDAIPSDHAALTEPLAVGLHAANLASRRGGPNIILGCGPVGLAVLLALKSQGRGPILAADFSAERRAIAEALGADIIVDPAQGSPYEHWDALGFEEQQVSPLLTPDLYGGALGPNIFDCVGAPGLIDSMIKSAPRHAHLIIVGVCPHEDKYTPQEGILKELSLEFSFAYTPAEFTECLKMIGDNGDAISKLITSRLPMSQTAEAFDRLATQPTEIKVLIEPS